MFSLQYAPDFFSYIEKKWFSNSSYDDSARTVLKPSDFSGSILSLRLYLKVREKDGGGKQHIKNVTFAFTGFINRWWILDNDSFFSFVDDVI